MVEKPTPSAEELILAMLRDVLARQAQQMGLTPIPSVPPAPPPSPTPDAVVAPPPVPDSEPGPPKPASAAVMPSPVETRHYSPRSEAERDGASLPPSPPAPPVPVSAPEMSTPEATAVAPSSPESTPPQPGPVLPSQPASPPPEPRRPIEPGSEFGPEPEPLSQAELAQLAEIDEIAAQPLAPGNLPRTLRALVVGLFVVLILINLPLFNGLALARALPDRQALIIRDGLVLKGSGPEIYVLESSHKRWISSLDAFEHYGYQWEDVHIVDDAFLNQFSDGRPLHVLLKCADSPHIYRLENDRKRWIKDIPTFEAEGHVWEDVRFVSCSYLRSISDGPPIPPDAGPPPQP